MDALDLLKTDHDQMKTAFDNFRTATSQREMLIAFRKIDELVSVHSFMEETVFYPAFSRYDEFKSIITSSMQEHKEVDDLLMQIENMEQHSPELGSKIHLLIDKVTAHVEKEERDLFPMVRKIMRRPEREALGRHLQAAKEQKEKAA
jgi:hemerythrin superfamily protein